MILQSSWESTLLSQCPGRQRPAVQWLMTVHSAAYYGLTNGGTGGVIWVTVGVILGALCMIASIGGMASMAPTAGGQCGYFSYFLLIAKEQIIDGREFADHWVSEFAPTSVEKPLSCIVSWLALLGWVTGCPAAAQLTSTLVQGLILLKDENASLVANNVIHHDFFGCRGCLQCLPRQ